MSQGAAPPAALASPQSLRVQLGLSPFCVSNAPPLVSLPNQLRCVDERSPCELADVQRAVRTSRVRGLVARRSGGQLVAVGHEQQLSDALRPLGLDVSDRTETVDWDAEVPDPADLGLALDAITLGLGRTDGLRHVLARVMVATR